MIHAQLPLLPFPTRIHLEVISIEYQLFIGSASGLPLSGSIDP